MAGAFAALVKAMLCNWMVTLGVVLPFTARSVIGKAIATFVPIYMFFAMGYEHMVVNQFIIPTAMLFGCPDLDVRLLGRKPAPGDNRQFPRWVLVHRRRTWLCLLHETG